MSRVFLNKLERNIYNELSFGKNASLQAQTGATRGSLSKSKCTSLQYMYYINFNYFVICFAYNNKKITVSTLLYYIKACILKNEYAGNLLINNNYYLNQISI